MERAVDASAWRCAENVRHGQVVFQRRELHVYSLFFLCGVMGRGGGRVSRTHVERVVTPVEFGFRNAARVACVATVCVRDVPGDVLAR